MAEEKCVSRRKLLRGAGYSIAGLTLASTMGMFLTGCSDPEASASPDNSNGEADVPVAQWPLSYTKLDPDKAAELAYAGYKEDG
jgi:hypothetical protein